MIPDSSSLTTGQGGIKGALHGSIRPRTDATARRADTHSAGVRSQAALSEVQFPKNSMQS